MVLTCVDVDAAGTRRHTISANSALQWYAAARPQLQRVTDEVQRYFALVQDESPDLRRAANSVLAEVPGAIAWLTAHPCPDPELRLLID